jgi:hypothetical protein
MKKKIIFSKFQKFFLNFKTKKNENILVSSYFNFQKSFESYF